MVRMFVQLSLCLLFAACGDGEPADGAIVASSSSSASSVMSVVPPHSSSLSFEVISSSSSSSSSSRLPAYPEDISVQALTDFTIVGSKFKARRILDQNAVYTRFYVTYEANGLEISGVMNVPNDDERHPLLVFNHGYIDPQVYTNGRGLKREQDYMARHGFAVLHIDYRGHADSDPNPDNRLVAAYYGYAIDALAAIDAIRKNPPAGVDTSKIGMLGHSLGGGVTMLAAVSHPEMIGAVALYAPVSGDAWINFLKWQDSGSGGTLARKLFGTKDSNPDFWLKLSPSSYFSRLTMPVRIYHGTADSTVPYTWSAETTRLMRDAGKTPELVTYENETHEFGPRWEDFMENAAAFFSETLK